MPVLVRTDDVLSHLMSQAVKRYIYFVNGGEQKPGLDIFYFALKVLNFK